MLLPTYSITRAMLILLHIKSLLSDSFSTTNLINDSSIKDKIIKKSLKDSLVNLDYTKLSRSNKLINESENLFNNLNSNLLFKKIIKRNKNLTNELNTVQDKHTNRSNEEVPSLNRSSYYGYIIFFSRILYGLVCIVGLCGNSLVIYVVLRFSKMQTVTNMYILNLAFADEMFLCGLPFLIITITYNYWAFGWLMCKIYMIMTSINQFTSSLLLTVMSADRYIAVCHPISSPRYRTQCIAKIICLSVWTLSAYLMIPIFIFADVQDTGDKLSCNIYWPEMYDSFKGQQAFTIYSFTLGFFVPLTLILLFYFLVICKLRTISTKHKSREKKKTQKKVTYLVLVVITVYISCWLPYWITQVYITFQPPDHKYNEFSFTVMLLAGCLSYANSAVNPILYAFLSENFKKSFKKAFTCAANQDVNAQLHGENSVFPQHLSKGKQSSSSKVETASTYLDSNQKKIKTKSKPIKLKDSKNQLANLSNKLNLKKNKRLSLDLSNTQINHLSNELQQNNIERNKLKLINNKLNSNKDEVQLVANEIDQQINNSSELNSIKFKRRRKSEPKLSTSNESNQSTSKNRRRSTLLSQDDIEMARTEKEESSSNDDIAYETDDDDGEYDDDEDDDSSLNSQTKRNCSAMPASLKAKFLSSSSKFRLRTLNLKSKNKRIANNIEVIKSSNNSRKISLASKDSETSQIKRSNKLINFMNKFTTKNSETRLKEEQTLEKRPETRISRKRISAQEAEHHRFGNLKRSQLNKLECKCENKKDDQHNENCLNNQSRNLSIYSDEYFKDDNNLDNENYEIIDNNLIQLKTTNDKNNNSNDDQFIKQQHDNCPVNNYTNNCCSNNFCESIECAQCSKCLEKRGVIQTQL